MFIIFSHNGKSDEDGVHVKYTEKQKNNMKIEKIKSLGIQRKRDSAFLKEIISSLLLGQLNFTKI